MSKIEGLRGWNGRLEWSLRWSVQLVLQGSLMALAGTAIVILFVYSSSRTPPSQNPMVIIGAAAFIAGAVQGTLGAFMRMRVFTLLEVDPENVPAFSEVLKWWYSRKRQTSRSL